MPKFSRRVVVYAAQSERIVLWASPLQAARLLRLRQAVTHTRHTAEIRCIQLTGQLVNIAQLGCKPGSFGIHRESAGYGVIFSHHRLLPQLA